MSHSHTILFTILALIQLVSLYQITKAVQLLEFLIRALSASTGGANIT